MGWRVVVATLALLAVGVVGGTGVALLTDRPSTSSAAPAPLEASTPGSATGSTTGSGPTPTGILADPARPPWSPACPATR